VPGRGGVGAAEIRFRQPDIGQPAAIQPVQHSAASPRVEPGLDPEQTVEEATFLSWNGCQIVKIFYCPAGHDTAPWTLFPQGHSQGKYWYRRRFEANEKAFG
jgi:hypothetical protein